MRPPSWCFVQGIISAGAVGFGTAVVFPLGGAPDLAFTQFSVEALSVVILLEVISHMPFRKSDSRSSKQQTWDAIISVIFGLMLIAVMFSVVALPFNESLSNFFRESSYPLAHGRNLVNVIIVNFRTLDTLGEITVLAPAVPAAVVVFFSPGGNDKRYSGDAPGVVGKDLWTPSFSGSDPSPFSQSLYFYLSICFGAAITSLEKVSPAAWLLRPVMPATPRPADTWLSGKSCL